jgi:hypothetical protein
MKQQSNYLFRYIYVDGDYVRVRVPGHKSISYNTKVYGSKPALHTAIKTRDVILNKART